MLNIKACIFDLDGVIVDTAKYHFIAWRRLANELGIDFTEKDNEKLKGVSRMGSLELILEWGGLSLDENKKLELAARKNEWYLEYILQMKPGEILPGVILFLDTLREKGIKIGLGSASKNAPTILNRLKLENYFESIIDGTKVTNSKPHPEVFLKGAAELGVAPGNCIVFEDASKGIDAALNGGMLAVGIGKEEDLGHAHFVIPDFENIQFDELLEHLNEQFPVQNKP